MINNDGWSSTWPTELIAKELVHTACLLMSIFIPMEWNDGSGEAPPVIIQAYRVGDLAVHKEANATDYRITHLPTTAKFDRALPDKQPGQRYSKQQLIEWCERVQEENLDDWALLRKLTRQTFDDSSDEIIEAKDRLILWCQSVMIK